MGRALRQQVQHAVFRDRAADRGAAAVDVGACWGSVGGEEGVAEVFRDDGELAYGLFCGGGDREGGVGGGGGEEVVAVMGLGGVFCGGGQKFLGGVCFWVLRVDCWDGQSFQPPFLVCEYLLGGGSIYHELCETLYTSILHEAAWLSACFFCPRMAPT